MDKKIKEKAMNKLMLDRERDMFNLFGQSDDINHIIPLLSQLKGLKRYYYVCIFLIETFDKLGMEEKRDKFKQSFEMGLANWSVNLVTSSFLAKLADELLVQELENFPK